MNIYPPCLKLSPKWSVLNCQKPVLKNTYPFTKVNSKFRLNDSSSLILIRVKTEGKTVCRLAVYNQRQNEREQDSATKGTDKILFITAKHWPRPQATQRFQRLGTRETRQVSLAADGQDGNRLQLEKLRLNFSNCFHASSKNRY